MLTIAWDVDDVLNDLMRAWLDRSWRPTHPSCMLTYDELTANPPHRLLGVSQEEYLASLDAFRFSRTGRNLPPSIEILAWFRKHGTRFRHLALTATPRASAPFSAAWVMHHFGDWIRSVHFIPSPRKGSPVPVYDRTKGDFLSWFQHADVVVDDHPGHVKAARELGLRAILVPRPWNQGRESVGEALDALVHLPDGHLR